MDSLQFPQLSAACVLLSLLCLFRPAESSRGNIPNYAAQRLALGCFVIITQE